MIFKNAWEPWIILRDAGVNSDKIFEVIWCELKQHYVSIKRAFSVDVQSPVVTPSWALDVLTFGHSAVFRVWQNTVRSIICNRDTALCSVGDWWVFDAVLRCESRRGFRPRQCSLCGARLRAFIAQRSLSLKLIAFVIWKFASGPACCEVHLVLRMVASAECSKLSFFASTDRVIPR